MATTLVITQGPSGEGFQGIFKTGIDLPIFYGHGNFTGTETTAYIPSRGGGLINVALVIAYYNVAEKTVTWAVDANGGVTLTRTDTTSGAGVDFLVVYN
jgi:hypothetical protein